MMSHIRESIRGREEWTVYEQIGFAVSCMLHNRNYSLYPVLTIQYWTEYAIQHNQIKFLFDSRGFPLAYITWAYLEADTEARLLNDPEFRLHPSEWDEDGRIWILGRRLSYFSSSLCTSACCLPARIPHRGRPFARKPRAGSALAEQEEENHDISAHAAT